jgi:acyl transferase domain-containing protein
MCHGWANEPIAIIGMSSKFAGEAKDNEGLWRMLTNARSGWTPFPHSRFRSEGLYHPNNERLNSVRLMFRTMEYAISSPTLCCPESFGH